MDIFIQLIDGERFDIIDPQPEMFDIEHVAHALSMINRYSGHTIRPYSVCEHSVHVAKVVQLLGGTPLEQLEGLMHDRAEAYIGDITSPLKRWLGDSVVRVEERIEEVSAPVFGVGYPTSEIVRRADRIMLWNERRDLLAVPKFEWRFGGEEGPGIYLAEPWGSWSFWKNRFLSTYAYLRRQAKLEESHDPNGSPF